MFATSGSELNQQMLSSYGVCCHGNIICLVIPCGGSTPPCPINFRSGWYCMHDIHMYTIPVHDIHMYTIPVHDIHMYTIPVHDIHMYTIPVHDIHMCYTIPTLNSDK